MPLLTVEAQKLSNDMLRMGVLENIITSDEMFALMPFIPINGRTFRYNRELTLGSAAFLDTDDTITESAATFTEITQNLKRLIGDVDVDQFLQRTHSDTNDQAAVQIAKKAKVVGRTFADKMINGDETALPKEFDGLRNLAPAGQSFDVATDGEPLAYDQLDQLIDLVKVGEQRAFIMNSRTRRSYIQLQRNLGGTVPETVSIGGTVFSAYRGIPILRNDFVPINLAQGVGGTIHAPVFLIAMDENEGVAGMMASDQAGIEVEDVGPVQDKDARRWRVKWYAALVLLSELSMAVANGINN